MQPKQYTVVQLKNTIRIVKFHMKTTIQISCQTMSISIISKIKITLSNDQLYETSQAWKMRWTTSTSAEEENILTTRIPQFRQTAGTTTLQRRDTSAKLVLSCIQDSRQGFPSDTRARAGVGVLPHRFLGCPSSDHPQGSLLCPVSTTIIKFSLKCTLLLTTN